MCDKNSLLWAEKNLERSEFENKRICEVGSYNVNGTLRSVVEKFNPQEYVGVDMESGPGVDIICRAENLMQKFGENAFDVVISTFVFEHIRNWKVCLSNLKRICKPNGLIIFAVPENWPYHSYPGDYWRYSMNDVYNIFSDCKVLKIEEIFERNKKHSLVFTKILKPDNFQENDLSKYKLYSIITNTKINEICNDHLRSWRYLKLSTLFKLKQMILRIRICKKIISKFNKINRSE
jgi:predicted SAM-dependent methyltransferase